MPSVTPSLTAATETLPPGDTLPLDVEKSAVGVTCQYNVLDAEFVTVLLKEPEVPSVIDEGPLTEKVGKVVEEVFEKTSD